jgi:hypothetical protein
MRFNRVLLYFRKRASRRGLGISNKIATSSSTATSSEVPWHERTARTCHFGKSSE